MKVKNNQYYFCENQDNKKFYTTYLQQDIAFSFYCPTKNVGGIARNLSPEKIKELFNALQLNYESDKVKLYVVGGDNSKESQEYAVQLLQTLTDIQGDHKLFDLTIKVNGALHPDFLFFDLE